MGISQCCDWHSHAFLNANLRSKLKPKHQWRCDFSARAHLGGVVFSLLVCGTPQCSAVVWLLFYFASVINQSLECHYNRNKKMETLSYTPANTLLSPLRSCLVLVDYQTGLMPAIAEQDKVIHEAQRLAQIAQLLQIPILATEQNPQRLGHTVPALLPLCDTRLEKVHFDACALKGLPDAIPTGRSQVVIAGCEAHVCLLQTA